MGSINKLSTIKSIFIVPINKNMTKIKINFFILPKETQQNRSAKLIIQDINSNKIYVKYYQKTDEMSIKNIQDSLNTVNNISSDLEKIDENKDNIASNLGRISTNEGNISSNLGKINNITKTIMLKNIYFTDFDSKKDEAIVKELLYLDNRLDRSLSFDIRNVNMEYYFKKDDFIEIDCKLML